VSRGRRPVRKAPNPAIGRARALAVIDSVHSCPIPEIARLGRTLRAWQGELLAYFDTDGASNGPTEATNLVIEKGRRTVHCYRNFANYRLRLLLDSGVTRHTQQPRRIRTRRPRIEVRLT